jgi:hypothetical protein
MRIRIYIPAFPAFILCLFFLLQIIKLVDVSYGGENGFNQAIELSAESLSNVKFIQEKKLIGRYFDEISQVMFIPDPNFFHPGSGIQGKKIPDPVSGSASVI